MAGLRNSNLTNSIRVSKGGDIVHGKEKKEEEKVVESFDLFLLKLKENGKNNIFAFSKISCLLIGRVFFSF